MVESTRAATFKPTIESGDEDVDHRAVVDHLLKGANKSTCSALSNECFIFASLSESGSSSSVPHSGYLFRSGHEFTRTTEAIGWRCTKGANFCSVS